MALQRNSNLTLVFCDSRGKNLDAFIDNEFIKVKAFKGAKLVKIVEYSTSYIMDHQPARVLFIGGTCDLTVKRHNSQHIRPRFLTANLLLAHMISVFEEARTLAASLFPDIIIAFGGLCGVDVNKYNRAPGFHPYQAVIDCVIDPLNWEIKCGNMMQGIIHPTLTAKILRAVRPEEIAINIGCCMIVFTSVTSLRTGLIL